MATWFSFDSMNLVMWKLLSCRGSDPCEATSYFNIHKHIFLHLRVCGMQESMIGSGMDFYLVNLNILNKYSLVDSLTKDASGKNGFIIFLVDLLR